MRSLKLFMFAVLAMAALGHFPASAQSVNVTPEVWDRNYGGEDAFRRGDYATAKTKLEPQCHSRKSANGCHILGVMYETGKGVPKNDARASEYYRKGCEIVGLSCQYLAAMYREGRGVPKDSAKASAYYTKACEYWGGSCEVAAEYAMLSNDRARAIGFLERACRHAGKKCQTVIDAYMNGNGVPQNKSKAVDLLDVDCRGGANEISLTSCANLGNLYFRGELVSQDKVRAFNLYRTVCRAPKNDATAHLVSYCVTVGDMYERGDGVAQDKSRATDFYSLACKRGFELACAKSQSRN